MAQALGGAYGLPHGAMNALCLPPALEFNSGLPGRRLRSSATPIGGDAVERSRELALLGGFERLRDFGIPQDDLPRLAEAAAGRAGNAQPAPGHPGRDHGALRSIW